MADDYSINAKITADTSGFEKGVKEAQTASKKLSNSISGVIQGLGKSGLVGALGAVGLASSGLTAAFGAVVKIAKKVSQTINECTDAYKTQLIAERQLTTAIENNPYVTGASENALKQFASEMQKVSNYGDEELIPMMANLVSLGRTEDETMKIMSVALDMSASGAMSLDTAITQLNATLNGNVGRLGQQNAELKGLTEEELKNGKAVEILGAKYKGLAQATQDTSKQLANVKSDFKEALGQFTLPSSDMWNKFWAGFYENGIKIITKLSDYIDANIVGKKVYNAMAANADIVAQAQGLSREDVISDFRYLKEQLKQLNDEELKAYQNYLANLKTRTTGEERMLTISKQILESRGLQEVQNKKDVEASAKKAKAEEEELARQKELAKLRSKQLQLEAEWGNKVLKSRIDNLEGLREKELENEDLTQEEREKIINSYGDEILSMRLELIEKEREEALSQEGLTEKARLDINLYYGMQITKASEEEEKKRKELKKKYGKEEVKEEKKKFSEMVKVAGEYTKKLAETFKNVASKIKSVFSKIGNIFTKLFDFDPDKALDDLLVFEDKILTFFVETLPKLPNFFASAIQSISVLFKTLGKVINFDVIGDILKTLVQGIADWVTGGGWKDLLDLVLALQMALEKAVEENIDLVVETLEKMLPDLVTTLTKSIVSASRTLGKIAKVLLPLVAKIIKAIVDVITSNEVVEASIEAVEGLIEGLIPAVVDIIVYALPKIINLFLLKLPSYTPQLLIGIINGLINAIQKVDFSGLVEGFFKGFDDALNSFNVGGFATALMNLFKKTMTLDFWVDILSNFATAIGTLLSETVKRIFQNPSSLIGVGSSSGGSTTSSGNSTASVVTSAILTGGLSLLWNHADGTNATHRGLAIVGEAGPELVRFNGGEQVLNNRNTNKALAEMGGKTNNFSVVFNNTKDTTAYTMMSQLRQYNRQLAINGIM